jgi:hypothetical protein
MGGKIWIWEVGVAKERDSMPGMRDSVQSSGRLSTIQEPPPPYGNHEPADDSTVAVPPLAVSDAIPDSPQGGSHRPLIAVEVHGE